LENDWKFGGGFQGNPNLVGVSLVQIEHPFRNLEERMPKKNLLVSAALTAFVLVVATGVVSAYKQAGAVIASVQPASVVQPVEMPAASPSEVPAPVTLTHQEAALVAANFLGRTDLYSVENAIWNGVSVYKVTFSSGDIVYVSLDGQVLGTETPQTVLIADNAGGSNNNVSDSSGREEHEEHDDD
jgi:hypothetical protein